MKRIIVLAILTAASAAVHASWYWPFGSEGEEKEKPRFSELIEQASLEIDTATDAIADDKLDEALEHYRKALEELDRVERENPDRAPTAEFASLRNKRALVKSSMEAIILEQNRQNAKAVQVTDTTELEKRFEERRQGIRQAERDYVAKMRGELKEEVPVAKPAAAVKPEVKKTAAAAKPAAPARPKVTKEEIERMLEKNPSDVKALNLKAMMQAESGDYKAAERTLDHVIECNPKSYYAYYNMAMLLLKSHPESRDAARRYYQTGRQIGGPVNEALERTFR